MSIRYKLASAALRAAGTKKLFALPEEELLAEANKWELFHGGLSGRTAQQFIDYLAGCESAAGGQQ